MTPSYNYRPLDCSKKEIRLLKLLPLGGSRQTRLIPICYVFHATLHDHPQYTALSYAWGTTVEPLVILVDDCAVRVTKNLYDAMMVLRLSHEPVVIWIDFLCINQKNDEEKSWQVALMAGIYQQAHKVTAWLGQADDSSDAVVDYLNMFGADAEACGLDYGPRPYEEIWQRLTPNAQEDGVSGRTTHMRMILSGNILPVPYQKVYATSFTLSVAGMIKTSYCRSLA
jgi:hypothetical protein